MFFREQRGGQKMTSCVAVFSLLTEGDVSRKVGDQDMLAKRDNSFLKLSATALFDGNHK